MRKPKVKLQRGLVRHMRRRKEVRQQTLAAAIAYVKRPVGCHDAEERHNALSRQLRNVRNWYGRRARVVLLAIQRRAFT